jgi:hypothetical protein
MLNSKGWRNPRELKCEAKGELRSSKELKVAWAGKQASEVESTTESESRQGEPQTCAEKKGAYLGDERMIAAGGAIATWDATARMAPVKAYDALQEEQSSSSGGGRVGGPWGERDAQSAAERA